MRGIVLCVGVVSVGRELFYLVARELEHCCSFEEVVAESTRILDELIVFLETYRDGWKPVVPLEDRVNARGD